MCSLGIVLRFFLRTTLKNESLPGNCRKVITHFNILYFLDIFLLSIGFFIASAFFFFFFQLSFIWFTAVATQIALVNMRAKLLYLPTFCFCLHSKYRSTLRILSLQVQKWAGMPTEIKWHFITFEMRCHLFLGDDCIFYTYFINWHLYYFLIQLPLKSKIIFQRLHTELD